ncbi:MAG: hypothetical protein EBE86_018385 [Hormoscilla sp. GUM202]|nr:hypothetical protein [Hormoscilla sp. GUM202]
MQKLLIGIVPQQEMAAAQQAISELQDYKNRYRAIGLNGDTLQPGLSPSLAIAHYHSSILSAVGFPWAKNLPMMRISLP